MQRDYNNRMMSADGRYARVRFASIEDHLAFERDLLLYGNAFVDKNGNHVPTTDLTVASSKKWP